MGLDTRTIAIRGARVHNLKNFDLDLPKGKLIAICGPSGSGKTSLAIDTLFVEGHRRYIESFSARVRRYLEDLPRPEVDCVAGLSPPVAITGSVAKHSATVSLASLTEIYDYLRIVYAQFGRVHCRSCGRLVKRWDSHSIESLLADLLWDKARVIVAFPLPFRLAVEFSRRKEGSPEETRRDLLSQGFTRVIVGKQLLRLDEMPPLSTVDHKTERAHTQTPQDLGLVCSAKTGTGDESSPRRGDESLVVVDRLSVGERFQSRLREALEAVEQVGAQEFAILIGPLAENQLPQGSADAGLWQCLGNIMPCTIRALENELWAELRFSLRFYCLECGIEYVFPHPGLFNFQAAQGACLECRGSGTIMRLDPGEVFPDPAKSLREGAIAILRSKGFAEVFAELEEQVLEYAKKRGIPVDRPIAELSEEWRNEIVFGREEEGFPGLQGMLRELPKNVGGSRVKAVLNRLQKPVACPQCQGTRLRSEALAVRLYAESCKSQQRAGAPHAWQGADPGPLVLENGRPLPGVNIAELCKLSVTQARCFIEQLGTALAGESTLHSAVVQVRDRLSFLEALGLGYLQLSRSAASLSQGEFRRALLAAALGSSLTNILYILDEPSVGLHPADLPRLRDALLTLRARRNTVVCVEHQETVLRSADWIVELGPGAGERGGEVVFQGLAKELFQAETLTGDYLAKRRTIPISSRRREPIGWIRLVGACGHNLKNLTVEFPLGVLCVVTGVSGAGKSTLVEGTFYPALCQALGQDGPAPLPFDAIMGERQVSEAVFVSQGAAAATARSNVLTVSGAFDEMRKVFAQTSDAKLHGFTPRHFSFNLEDGQCPRCRGEGTLTIDMEFLPDMELTCPECRGRRYRPEVLSVIYRGKSIADVLAMTVREAYFFFRGHNMIQGRLRRLMDVGLDYLRLGQSIASLSAGEAQRLRLASYLSRSKRKPCLFILDEPTAGLHPHDIARLLECFDLLLGLGHSLFVIDHNMAVAATADHVIDLGPGPGDKGGTIVASGPPERVAHCEQSVTGRFLREILLTTANEN